MLNRKFKLLSLLLTLMVVSVSFPESASAATTCNMSITKDEVSRTVFVTATIRSNTGDDWDGIGISWGESEYGTQVGSMDGTTNTQTFNLENTYYSAGTYDINFFTESKACNVWGQVSFDVANSQPGSICQSTTNGVYGSWYLTAPDGVTSYSITNTTNNCCMDVPGDWTIWGVQNVNGYGTPFITPSSAVQHLPSGGSISWVINYPPSSTPTIPTIAGPNSGSVNLNSTFTLLSTDPANKQIRYGVDWSSPLDGVVDEWFPAGGSSGVLTTTWSKVSGPGTVTFADPSAAVTSATFSQSGTYVLKLTATNGTISSSDNVTVAVNPATVAFWKFDEYFGSTMFYDSSGNSTSAYCYSNCPTSGTSGKDGNALSFNGTNQSLEVTYDPNKPLYKIDASKSYSISFWIKPSRSLDGWRGIIGGDYNYNGLLSGGDNHNSIGFYLQGTRTSSPANSVPLNTWTHVAATFDGTTKSIYINGVLVAQGNMDGANTYNSGSALLIGENIYGSYFGGILDDLRVFNKALSASEVLTLATATNGSPGSGTTNQTITANAGPDQVINLPGIATLNGSASDSASSSNVYVNSGVSRDAVHSWSTIGSKQFQVMAQNTDGSNSAWSSPYSINISSSASFISASPTTVSNGGSSTITWSSTNADFCEVSPGGWSGTSGSHSTGALSLTTTYTVSCVNGSINGSSSATATVTVSGSGPTVNVTKVTGGTVKSVGNSSIDCGPTCTNSYSNGATVTLRAYPSAYFKFAGWTTDANGHGDCTGTGDCVLNVTGAKYAVPSFVPRSASTYQER